MDSDRPNAELNEHGPSSYITTTAFHDVALLIPCRPEGICASRFTAGISDEPRIIKAMKPKQRHRDR
jgi:hypothetical protein